MSHLDKVIGEGLFDDNSRTGIESIIAVSRSLVTVVLGLPQVVWSVEVELLRFEMAFPAA